MSKEGKMSSSHPFRNVIVCLTLGTLAATASAQADQTKTGNGWTFEISPYLWMSGVRGDVGVFERLPPSSIDVSFGDIFNHIDWPAVVFVSGEAWKGRFAILGDVQYIKLKASASTPGPLFGTGTLVQQNFHSTIAGAYRFIDSPKITVDGLAGARIFYVNNELTLTSALLRGRSGSSSDAWVNPVIGVRGTLPFATGFSVDGYLDAGGFGISSDWTWQIYGGVGYRFKKWLTAYAGYRYLDVRHRNGGFLYDVTQQGPVLGIRFIF
ncbi:hypothetical protein PQQ81_15990 [Paraburkholderia strydomiana]|uniref:hypothetical protein n=1 Tax=Paraburkholderia strydomiana TaxID=1245417 RepID=UPI0038BD81A5